MAGLLARCNVAHSGPLDKAERTCSLLCAIHIHRHWSCVFWLASCVCQPEKRETATLVTWTALNP